jgi:translation elongation factor EF-Ts
MIVASTDVVCVSADDMPGDLLEKERQVGGCRRGGLRGCMVAVCIWRRAALCVEEIAGGLDARGTTLNSAHQPVPHPRTPPPTAPQVEMGKEDLKSKPEAVRAKIVEGRLDKIKRNYALLEQPALRDNNKSVTEIIKETIAAVGENIQVRLYVGVSGGWVAGSSAAGRLLQLSCPTLTTLHNRLTNPPTNPSNHPPFFRSAASPSTSWARAW